MGVKLFEENYLKHLQTVKGVNKELQNELEERVVDSLLDLLKWKGISYDKFIITELKCVVDSECNGNPFHFGFSSDFLKIYAGKDEKFGFIEFLLDKHPPDIDLSEVLIQIARKIVEVYRSDLGKSQIHLLGLLLRDNLPMYPPNADSVSLFRELFEVIKEDDYLQDMGRGITLALQRMENREAYEFAKLFINHPIEFIREEMLYVIHYYESQNKYI